MIPFLVLVALLVGGFLAYRHRVALIAKVLGQPQSRIERRLNGPRK